ncbi:MAG: LacI family transcriptional regulator [Cytophagales bacterium]|nr:LacI family transcriptional regulator [Cytophagales bacterium]
MGQRQGTTIYDIAKELRISAATVSRALKDHARISEKTKVLVREAAARMGYEPNVMASSLRTGRANSLGVVVSHVNRFFHSNVIGGIEEVANEMGHTIIICQSHESEAKEAECINTLLAARVAGILITVSKETRRWEHLQKVLDWGVPLVFFDRAVEYLPASSVVIDDYQGAYQMVSHMVEQGCRRIAHFGGPDFINIYRNRRRGYRQALLDHGLEPRPDFQFDDVLTMEIGQRNMETVMGLADRPDAIFCASDYSALGVLLYCKERGIRVPEEMCLSGFANEPFTQLTTPSISTVEQFAAQQGSQAAQLLLSQINQKEQSYTPQRVVLPPQLLIRDSTLRQGQKKEG